MLRFRNRRIRNRLVDARLSAAITCAAVVIARDSDADLILDMPNRMLGRLLKRKTRGLSKMRKLPVRFKRSRGFAPHYRPPLRANKKTYLRIVRTECALAETNAQTVLSAWLSRCYVMCKQVLHRFANKKCG
jgi:hypothetical protein